MYMQMKTSTIYTLQCSGGDIIILVIKIYYRNDCRITFMITLAQLMHTGILVQQGGGRVDQNWIEYRYGYKANWI